MKKLFSIRIFKTISLPLLIFGLIASSCGIKKSIQQVFNLENNSSHGAKLISSCQFVQIQSEQKSQQIAVKKIGYSKKNVSFTDQISISFTDQPGIKKARSVPLYILYRQLRTSLV